MFSRHIVNLSKRFSSTRIPALGCPDQLQKETNLVPRSLSETLVLAINGQINREYCAAYVYRSMAYHFAASSVSLLGLAEFYRKLATDEIGHAEQLADVLLLRDGPVTLEAIAKPTECPWSADIGQTLRETVALETELSRSLSLLHETAEAHRDVVLMDFVTTRLLQEQCESMRTLQQLTAKWNQLRGRPDGSYWFDREVSNWNGSPRPRK